MLSKERGYALTNGFDGIVQPMSTDPGEYLDALRHCCPHNLKGKSCACDWKEGEEEGRLESRLCVFAQLNPVCPDFAHSNEERYVQAVVERDITFYLKHTRIGMTGLDVACVFRTFKRLFKQSNIPRP